MNDDSDAPKKDAIAPLSEEGQRASLQREIRIETELIRRRRKLTNIGLLLLVGTISYFFFTAQVREPDHLYLGISILILSVVPVLLWAKRKSTPLPIFEIFALTGINTYAIPILNGHIQLQKYDSDTITTTAWAVLLYQVSLIVTYLAVGGQPAKSRFFLNPILPRKVTPYIGYGLWLTTSYIFIDQYTTIIPYQFTSIIRAVVFGIGMVCVFIATYEWGQGNIHPRDRSILVLNIFIQFSLQIAGLVMIGGIALAVLSIIGYISGSKKIPIFFILILVPLLAVLHNGKSSMREKYWDINGARKEQLSITDLPRYFGEWINDGLKKHDQSVAEKREQEITSKLLERSSLFHMLCLVVAYSPDRQPFLEGETYWDIPGQFVPRFLWPEKPRGHVSTYRLSTYYGLQRIEDTAKTTVGFGLLPEAYANFGFIGALLLGISLGTFYKKIHIATQNCPLVSNGGFILIVLMAWSYQTEMTMSIWISSMFQALIAVIGIPFLLRHLFH